MRAAMIAGVLGCLLLPQTAHADFDGLGASALKAADEVILPGYEALIASAEAEARALSPLCDAPSARALDAARQDYLDLVSGFGRVEFVRFGPAREDFRYSRIFFWPDRRGRGLKQVRALIHDRDTGALEPRALREKSVAVQGLGALEFVLFGEGAEILAGPDGGFRCRYALAIANNIADLAQEILADWTRPGGFRSLLASPGPENPRFRSGKEAMQMLVDAAREQIQFVREHKLLAVLGLSPDEARPKRAPLWRSGGTLVLVEANIAAVDALFTGGRLDGPLQTADGLLAEELSLELDNALKAVSEARYINAGATAPFASTEGHGLLLYATAPLGGAANILGDRLPRALGLVSGFNALDGD